MKTIITLFFTIGVTIFALAGNDASGDYLVRCNEQLINIVMEDIFNPPVASRVHVYPNIAAYEVLCKKDKTLRSMAGQLTGLEAIPEPVGKVDFSLSALVAFSTVAKKLVYTEQMITAFERTEYSMWLDKNKQDSALMSNSITYGKTVAAKIISWLKKDNYDYTRTLSRYVLSDTAGSWQPTGPDYMNALEPNWPFMRSFVFDSTNKIKVIPNVTYSEDKNSLYYKNAMILYNQSISLDTNKKLIASYWDDNPNILKSGGHLSYFVHKVGPPGHWIRIAGQAIRSRKLNEIKTAEIYTTLTIGIFEGLLSCWTEKYSSNAVRPETYLNKLVAPRWRSYIETPPFPEYTSGHSVVSSVSATILTDLIEQPYAFTDSSEMYIDLPSRPFKSFRDAANEASISRFYGGIHYMPSLDNGIVQGKEIGKAIRNKIQFSIP